MREAIERIERYAGRGWEEFASNELIQVWVVRHLEIIGEAARGLSAEFRREHHQVPWREIAAMRNLLAHEHFDIDLAEVWAAVDNELPTLKASISGILERG
jgi:uncharacterized protein with HEPN domain